MSVDVIRLLDAHATWLPCVAAPRISAWRTTDEVPLWQALERNAGTQVPVPYFCIAWPGAQALAAVLLEGAQLARGLIDVKGRTVADVGCGSGVAACAASLAGAARVLAIDADPLAVASAVELARRHGAHVEGIVADGLALEELHADVVLAADLVSRQVQRDPFVAAVARWRTQGRTVVLADSGRPFFEACGLPLVHTVHVDVDTGVDSGGLRAVHIHVGAP